MLDTLKGNIEKLISAYETQKQRADELSAALERSKAEVESCKTKIAELRSEADRAKLSGAFTGAADTSQSKETLDKLIREIDKCIKLLEQ